MVSKEVDEIATELDAAERAVYPLDKAVRTALLVRSAEGVSVVDLEDGRALVVGRGSEASVPIEGPNASRRHAEIRRTGERVSVRDLGSRNGTLLNGVAIEGEAQLLPGDVLRVGPADIALIALGAGDTGGATKAEPPLETLVEADRFPDGVIVADQSMVRVFDLAKRVARLSTTVLVVGETGVGKEVVASRIHAWSPRASLPLLSLNIASLPESLLEAELFGYEKGAFTGATARKIGYFERADKGTLFLDEIGEISPLLQVKLLRALEARRIVRVGSTEEVEVDVRVIAATHRDLAAEVRAGRFREDLFYRLGAFVIRVPALRERPVELSMLARHFIDELARRNGTQPLVLSQDAERRLAGHVWPGNVRELRNAIEHAFVLADHGTLSIEHLPPHVLEAQPGPQTAVMRSRVDDVEKRTLEEALTATGGNQTRAAERLGVSRRTLLNKMAKFGIKGPRQS